MAKYKQSDYTVYVQCLHCNFIAQIFMHLKHGSQHQVLISVPQNETILCWCSKAKQWSAAQQFKQNHTQQEVHHTNTDISSIDSFRWPGCSTSTINGFEWSCSFISAEKVFAQLKYSSFVYTPDWDIFSLFIVSAQSLVVKLNSTWIDCTICKIKI